MEKIIVGYQGVQGAYGHTATEAFFVDKDVCLKNFLSFEDVVEAVVEGKIKYGVLPIENSSTGGITEVYDLIRSSDCYIVGEQCVKVDHCLLAYPGTTINNIKEVYSHPQGFAQCRPFFKEHPHMQLMDYFNTAKAAELVAEKKTKTMAAVASAQAAKLYGLEVLAQGINANNSNYTRFFVIAKEQKINKQADKITIVVALKHEPGSLYRLLGCFANNNVNMLNIESRPITGRPWEYFFHIDVGGNLSDLNVKKAIEEVREDAVYYKILGNYTAAKTVPTPNLNKNVVLIGMPGAGKSTIGRQLAKKIKAPFFDADDTIVELAGQSIKELFVQGEDVFREQETEAIKLLSGKQGIVIACGGGVILRDINMQLLHKTGIVIFLNRSPDEILKNINASGRPLLAGGKNRIKELYAARIGKYTKYSDYIIDVEEPMNATLPKIEKILKLMGEKI